MTAAASSLVYDCEVDVVVDRSVRPWRTRTHHVQIAVDDRANLTTADLEARNLAAFMCWGIRGDLVAAVRIVACQL